jgi:hypothetical protein
MAANDGMSVSDEVLEYLRGHPRSGINAIRADLPHRDPVEVKRVLAQLQRDGAIRNDRKHNIYRIASPLPGNACVQLLLRTLATRDHASRAELIAAVSQIQAPQAAFALFAQMCVAGWLIKVKGNRYQITTSGMDVLPKAAGPAFEMTPYKPPKAPPLRSGALDFRAAPSVYPEGIKPYASHT